MTTTELYNLYCKTQKGDKEAIKEFINYYATKFPTTTFIGEPTAQTLNTMYLHLTL